MQLEGDAPSGRLGLEARYHLRLSQRVHEHAFHRLGLWVVVGKPGTQAEAGSLGIGPDAGVGERQRRPAGGAVQARHGAHPG